MTNTATKPSVTSPAFIITPRIASKLKSLDRGLALTGFSVQRDDYELHPYGTINRPFYNFDMALDALACCKAAHPDRNYHIQQFGHCAFGRREETTKQCWQEAIDKPNNPFQVVWMLQHIADCLNAFTLSDDCKSVDLHDASQACFAVADAIKLLLASFTPDQHAFSDAMTYYATQGNTLYQAAMNAEMEATA